LTTPPAQSWGLKLGQLDLLIPKGFSAKFLGRESAAAATAFFGSNSYTFDDQGPSMPGAQWRT